MLKILMRKELLEILLSFKFVVTSAICMIALVTSILLGAIDYRADLQQYNSSKTVNRANLRSYTSWENLGLQGMRVAKPPSPLTIFSAGLQGVSGKVFAFSTRELPHPEGAEVTAVPILALFGELDPTFIVGVIASLFALLFAYDSISGEKERGTLKLILSNSVPRDNILLGKLAGGFSSVLIALLVPFFTGVLLVLLFFPVDMRGGQWLRLLFILLTFLVYLLCFFCLGLLVSSRTNRPAVSFLVCLLIWVVFVNVFPKAAVLIARRISPVPSIHEMVAEQVSRSSEYAQRATEDALELSRGVNRGDFSIEDYGRRAAEMRAALDEEFTRRDAAYQELVQQKARNSLAWAKNLSRLSPLSAMRYATMNLADSGMERDERFLKMLAEHRQEFVRFVNQNAANENVAIRVFSPEPPKPLDLTGLPEFQFREESLWPALARALPDLLILLLYSVLFFTLSFFSFRHYDPR